MSGFERVTAARRRGILSVVSVVAAAGAIAVGTPGVAAAAGLTNWKQFVVAFNAGGSVELGADLSGPAGALVAPSAGVTLDLDGHRLAVGTPGQSVTLDPANRPDATASYPGIRVPSGASLTITDSASGGSLTVQGESNTAGIALVGTEPRGALTIAGGTVTATGGAGGAGIGGGVTAPGGRVSVTGGTVIATGGQGAPGIGSGLNGTDAGSLSVPAVQMAGFTGTNGGAVSSGVSAPISGNTAGRHYQATDGPSTVTIVVGGLVTFNANGGSPTPTSRFVVSGNEVAGPAAPGRTGYGFTGWHLGAAGGRSWAFATDKVTGDVALVADWTPNPYHVAFKANGGSRAMSVESFSYGTAKQLTKNNFTRTGYTFAGWARSASGPRLYVNQQSVKNLTATKNATVWLYAKWTANAYKVAFHANGGSGSMAAESFTYNTAKALSANVFTRNGYTFAGWARTPTGARAYTNKQAVKNLSSTQGATVALYAVWTPVTYAIKYNLAGGSVSGNPTTYRVTTATFTLKDPKKAGWTFGGWTGTDIAGKRTSVTIPKGSTGNRSYAALWLTNR